MATKKRTKGLEVNRMSFLLIALVMLAFGLTLLSPVESEALTAAECEQAAKNAIDTYDLALKSHDPKIVADAKNIGQRTFIRWTAPGR